MNRVAESIIPLLVLTVCSLSFNIRLLAKPLPVLDINQLWLDRSGTHEHAYMRTDSLLTYVIPQTSYQVFADKLMPTQYKSMPELPETVAAPRRSVFEGEWQHSNDNPHAASVLGGIGQLVTNCKRLEIPIVTASEDSLAYYRARLIKHGDIITIHSPMPLIMTYLSVGKTYVSHYIMVDHLGGGAYLEYHDTPHFHMPANPASNGYLILGGKLEHELQLTAFKIPFGFGVYTPPNVIHSDAHLIGEYIVMYTSTDVFSTVNLKNSEGELTELYFIPEQQTR